MSARTRLERICGPQTPPELITELDAYCAEVLREAQDATVAWLVKKAREYRGVTDRQESAADALARMADKASRGAVRVFLEAAASAPQTVYRASHDAIVMGLYTNREAAREHCETVLRRELGAEEWTGWVPEDGSEDAPEELCFSDEVLCSGYIVTPLEVASAYDPDGDE